MWVNFYENARLVGLWAIQHNSNLSYPVADHRSHQDKTQVADLLGGSVKLVCTSNLSRKKLQGRFQADFWVGADSRCV